MPDERIRLFVALELPRSVRDALIGWREHVLARARGLRALGAESLHVTLCFLGSQDRRELDAIAAACGGLSGQPVPRLSLGGARWLPPRRPRVLAVGLHDSTNALGGAQARLSQALAAGGWYTPEKRPHLAHVSVARVGRGARVPREPLPEVPAVEFEARTVTLFRSLLSREGAQYEPLTRIELG